MGLLGPGNLGFLPVIYNVDGTCLHYIVLLQCRWVRLYVKTEFCISLHCICKDFCCVFSLTHMHTGVKVSNLWTTNDYKLDHM